MRLGDPTYMLAPFPFLGYGGRTTSNHTPYACLVVSLRSSSPFNVYGLWYASALQAGRVALPFA